MFNVAICDDDKNFIQYVEDIIKELGYAEDVKFFEYLSGEEFLFDIDERGDLDLVVLDIQMGETDGNQVSVELRKRYKSTTLVSVQDILNHLRRILKFRLLDFY